jgi:hypothetical protein
MKLQQGKSYEFIWPSSRADGSSDDFVILADEGDGWYRVKYESGLGADRQVLVNANQARIIAPIM